MSDTERNDALREVDIVFSGPGGELSRVRASVGSDALAKMIAMVSESGGLYAGDLIHVVEAEP
jgi:hypothetical protein